MKLDLLILTQPARVMKMKEKTWRDTKYSEEEFYALQLPEQRRLLGLPEGVNPSKPSFLSMPKGVVVPVPYKQ